MAPLIPRPTGLGISARLRYDPSAAKVRWRIKGGQSAGIVYQGQRIFSACTGCAPLMHGERTQPPNRSNF